MLSTAVCVGGCGCARAHAHDACVLGHLLCAHCMRPLQFSWWLKLCAGAVAICHCASLQVPAWVEGKVEFFNAGDSILDLGCADGLIGSVLQNLQGDMQFTGLDLSKQMVKKCLRNGLYPPFFVQVGMAFHSDPHNCPFPAPLPTDKHDTNQRQIIQKTWYCSGCTQPAQGHLR